MANSITPLYECDRCGLCCRKLIVEIYEFDIQREPKLASVATEYRMPSMEGHSHMLVCGKPCHFLGDDNRCGIYPTRPTDCVQYAAGDEHCQNLREECGLPPNRTGSTKPLNVHIWATDIEMPMIENVLRKAGRVDADTREQEELFRGNRYVEGI